MPKALKPLHTVENDRATIEVGKRSGRPAFKMIFGNGSTFIVDTDTANDLADALDEAINAVENDPLLWGDGGSL